MPTQILLLLVVLVFSSNIARAQDDCTELIQGVVPEGEETHFFIDFEVPEGTAEIEVRHEDLSSANILDWGLDDPNGFRGWGGGKSEPAIVNERAASPSYVPGPIVPGVWEVVVGKAQIEETPAEYEVCIILRTEPTLEPQPRSPYQDPGALNDETRWYAGDFHIHTVQSDGRPTMREALEFADSVGLDFVMLSEHNTNSGLTLYGDLQPDFPTLLMIPGFEWTSYSGHAHAIGATEWVDQKIGVRGITMEGAIQGIQEQGAIFSIDHPTVPGGTFCIGCPWDIPVDPTSVEGVEVQGGIWEAIDFYEDLCADGSHATAVGGSDDHEGGQGSGVLYSPMGMPTTMVYASELSVAGIIEGVRNGRVVTKVNSNDDPMLETELSGERVGNTVFSDSSTLSVRVTEGSGNTLQIIKNGSVVQSVSVDSDPFVYQMAVEAPAEGEDRYRHQVVDAALEPTTIGSYVWLRASEGSSDDGSSSGCSCRAATASDRDTLFLSVVFAFGALFWRRRR